MADSVEPDQVVDADVVESPSQEIARQDGNAALFNTDDPVEVIEVATKVATALKAVVTAQGLVANISGKEHPKVEAWQTLGAMLGVHAVPVGEPRALPWPTPFPSPLKAAREGGKEFGFTATYRAMKAGAEVGGGSARCARTERRWATADDYAISSMAQTRAISKCLSGPLRFVMALAGYETTPADEMPGGPGPAAAAEPERQVLSPRGVQRFRSLIEGAGLDVAEVVKEARVASGKLEDVDADAASTIEAIVATRVQERIDAERDEAAEA